MENMKRAGCVCGELLILILLLQFVTLTEATITLVHRKSKETVHKILDRSISFNTSLILKEKEGVTLKAKPYWCAGESDITIYDNVAYLVLANPSHACSRVAKPPHEDLFCIDGGKSCDHIDWILLARGSLCDLNRKICNAYEAGYSALIVYNEESDSANPDSLISFDNEVFHQCNIKVSFVTELDGLHLKNKFTYPHNKLYHINIETNINWSTYCVNTLFKATENMFEILKIALTKGWTKDVLQILLLGTPMYFLVTVIYCGRKEERYEHTEWRWEYDQNQNHEINKDDERKYCNILGIEEDATVPQIEKAFRRKSPEVHPDKFPEMKEQKTVEFQELLEARDKLIQMREASR